MSAPFARVTNAGPLPQRLVEFGRPVTLIGGMSLLRNLLLLVPPLLALQIYQRMAAGPGSVPILALLLAAVGLSYAGVAALDSARRRILGDLLSRVEDQLGGAQLRRAATPPGAEVGRPEAALIGRDLDCLLGFATAPASQAFLDLAFVPVFLVASVMLHWGLGLAALIGAAIQMTVLALTARATRMADDADIRAARTYALGDAISRHPDCVSTMGLGAALAQRWQTLRAAQAAGETAGARRTLRLEAAARTCRAAAPFLVLGAGALVMRDGPGAGAAIAGFLLARQALAPIAGVTTSWRAAQVALGALRRLQTDMPEPVGAADLRQARGELVLEAVAWTPHGALRPALRGITLKIEAGAVLAVIGPSAAGKSTLARVLCGAVRPSLGVVRLDGIDLGGWSDAQRGASIGYLPQDVALFPGSIAENIARFGTATEFQIVAAARLAGVHELIRQLPDGYRTVVDNQACLLSAGQRQRVALARALLGDPPVLVLDEPDASLDAEGEAALIACMIEARRRRRTVIMITHNTGLVRVADFVATMVGGHVMKVQRTAEVLGRPAMLATG